MGIEKNSPDRGAVVHNPATTEGSAGTASATREPRRGDVMKRVANGSHVCKLPASQVARRAALAVIP